MQKKILYISYDGMTDNLGQSQVIPYLIELSKKGFHFSILSFEKKEKYKINKQYISDILRKNKIDWFPLSYTSNPPVLSTLIDIRKMIRMAKKLHQQENFSLLHCRSYISAFAGIFMKKKYAVKFLFDMRGFWADERVDGKIWSLKNPIFKTIYNFFKSQEINYLNLSNYTISLTENAKKEIHNWKKIKQNPIPIKVIPCCADFHHFNFEQLKNDEIEKAKKELGIERDDFVLSYLGSVGTWYMLEEMLDFFKVLLQKKKSSKFLFISGEKKDFILNLVKEKNIDINKIIIISLPREKVPLYLSLSSISIFFIKPVYSKKASSPTKLAEIMSLGIPIICNGGVGDIEKIIVETKAGLIVENFSDNAYKKLIDKIDNLLTISKKEIRKCAEKKFSLSVGASLYYETYREVFVEN